jgi:metal-responsive CopG/Arc/MetJ family transcriptional regulator
MVKSAKVAISLREDLLRDVERERRASGETRSEFFRRAVEALLRRERDREAIEQYIQGYLQHPETEDEVRWVEAASQEALAENPWHDEAQR